MSGRDAPGAHEASMSEIMSNADFGDTESETAAARSECDAGIESYAARWRSFRQHQARILPRNKAELFDVLVSGDVATVTVTFDGCGDSGQIESINAFDSSGDPIQLPTTTMEIAEIELETLATRIMAVKPSEAIEALVYWFLETTHGGWEDNDGAFGEFTFTVADQSIMLDYNERYTDSRYYAREF